MIMMMIVMIYTHIILLIITIIITIFIIITIIIFIIITIFIFIIIIFVTSTVMSGVVERVYLLVSSYILSYAYICIVVIWKCYTDASVFLYDTIPLCDLLHTNYDDDDLCYIPIIFINIVSIITAVIIVNIIIIIITIITNFNITIFTASPAMFSFQGPKIVMGRGIAVSGTFVTL